MKDAIERHWKYSYEHTHARMSTSRGILFTRSNTSFVDSNAARSSIGDVMRVNATPISFVRLSFRMLADGINGYDMIRRGCSVSRECAAARMSD